MRWFIIGAIFLLIGGLVFAYETIPSFMSPAVVPSSQAPPEISNTPIEMSGGAAGPASADVRSNENRRNDETEKPETRVVMATENIRSIAGSRNSTVREVARNLREKFKSRCEAGASEDIKKSCQGEIEKFGECRNVTAGSNETECKKNLVAGAALYMVRQRHDLSEQCLELTGENRSACQKRVNAIFRNEIHAKFLAFVKARENRTLEELNESDMREIREKHRNRTAKIRGKLNESKEKLFDRLENAINARENRVEGMQQFIEKANGSGHETEQLEFLLSEYRAVMVSARSYVEAEQYRDTIAALQESQRIFMQFRQSAAKLIRIHKQGLKYEVDEEREFAEDEDPEEDG